VIADENKIRQSRTLKLYYGEDKAMWNRMAGRSSCEGSSLSFFPVHKMECRK
jgi:hypothetical protein